MRLGEVRRLFTLYSGEDGEAYLPILRMALKEVEERLKDDADRDDPRLEGLCAALAYFQWAKLSAARELQRLTLSGNSPTGVDVTYRVRAAKAAADSAEESCAGLLRDKGFCFFSAKG